LKVRFSFSSTKITRRHGRTSSFCPSYIFRGWTTQLVDATTPPVRKCAPRRLPSWSVGPAAKLPRYHRHAGGPRTGRRSQSAAANTTPTGLRPEIRFIIAAKLFLLLSVERQMSTGETVAMVCGWSGGGRYTGGHARCICGCMCGWQVKPWDP